MENVFRHAARTSKVSMTKLVGTLNRVVSLYSEQRKLTMTAVTALWVDWENIRHFATSPLVLPRSDVGERSATIPYRWRDTTQMWMMLLICWKFASTNQKHYPDLGSERHQYGISALVSQTSFRGETSVGVSKCWLFSQATLGADSTFLSLHLLT